MNSDLQLENPTPPARTVMIVEDYDDTRLLLSALLQARGCRVVEATDGQQAVNLAPRERPDLILMDLSLPVMDGISATRLIHADPATCAIPIIAVSAHCKQTEWCRRALEAGCLECVGKPIDFSDLESLLQRFAP